MVRVMCLNGASDVDGTGGEGGATGPGLWPTGSGWRDPSPQEMS